VSELLVHPEATPAPDGALLRVTPESAGWAYVGFEVLALEGRVERDTNGRECCIVVISGSVDVTSDAGEFPGVGGRSDPWSGPPDAVYLPPGTRLTLSGEGEVALCWAPAPGGGARARLLPGDELEVETRGYGAQERTIHPILMGDREAESLLVCEVLTPGGHWSSYPPHKHDRDAVVRRPRLRAGPARLPHGLGAPGLRPVLPQRDGRPHSPVGRGQ
jgi:5-deoxy-glucuronate isomerase